MVESTKNNDMKAISPDIHLVKLTPPRKIDLAEQKALLGVDVPDSLDLPKNMPVFLGYQAKWFKDESHRKIPPYRADLGGSGP